jgi:competence protein ComEC
LTVFRTDQSLNRWIHYTVGNWLMDAAVLAVVAYVSAVPLMAVHFGLFTPYAAVLSLALFPLVAVVLIPGYVSMALLWPLPGLAYTIGRSASWAAGLLSDMIGATACLPALTVELRPLTAGWALLCYAAALAIVFARKLPFGKSLAVTCLAGVAVWTALSQLASTPPPAAELHLLAVGAGQCGLLRVPSGATYIIDAGTMADYDACEQVLRPAMRAMRMPDPEVAFVSHANIDHFNALSGLIQDGTLRRMYLNEYFAADEQAVSFEESAPAELMQLGLDKGVQVLRLQAGGSLWLDERTHVKVLWPPASPPDSLSVNDTSLVLRITCDARSVLVTGDLDEVGQSALATAPRSVASDALVLPHHGGWEPSLPAFVKAVSPKVLLASTRRDPTAGSAPPTSAKARFYNDLYSRRRYYSTKRHGHLMLRFGAGRLEVSTAWQDEKTEP